MRFNATIAALVVGAVLIASGCTKPGDATGVSVSANSGEKHYPLTGEIVSVDTAHRLLTVRHDPVAGLMPAMTMEFPVSAGDAGIARPGGRIRADLVVDKSGARRLERIWPDDPALVGAVKSSATALREDTHDRGDGAYRERGEKIPDFALFDQSGQVVQTGRFRGKMIMLNFIYSRCPFADMCPAATAKMMSTQRQALEAGIRGIEFVSITLDPVNDTPGVLKEYAESRGIDTSNFSFLTGPESAIRDLLTQFGVQAIFEGDLVKHTLATLLIDASGTIIYRADGSAWEPADFIARMHRAAAAAKP